VDPQTEPALVGETLCVTITFICVLLFVRGRSFPLTLYLKPVESGSAESGWARWPILSAAVQVLDPVGEISKYQLRPLSTIIEGTGTRVKGN